MFNKKIFIIILVISIIIGVLFFAVRTEKNSRHQLKKESNVVAVGLKPSQQEYFSEQLSNSFNEVALLEKGTNLMSQGRLDEAAKHFESLLANKKFELKGNAIAHLIDIFEKKKEYAKAYSMLYEDVQKNYKVPPTHEARIPVEERLKYLKYASEGEYALAVKHAQAALEASKKDKILKTIPMLYQQRLNDLIASKEYIESLKK